MVAAEIQRVREESRRLCGEEILRVDRLVAGLTGGPPGVYPGAAAGHGLLYGMDQVPSGRGPIAISLLVEFGWAMRSELPFMLPEPWLEPVFRHVASPVLRAIGETNRFFCNRAPEAARTEMNRRALDPCRLPLGECDCPDIHE